MNRQYAENMRKRVLQKAIDNPEEHYSKKAAHQLTDYSHYNKPNTECYGIGIPRGFFDEHHQPSNESDASLINPDNNNRPNTSCCEMSHKGDSSETTAVVKLVDESVLGAISQLRQVLNECVTDVGQQESKVEQWPKVEAPAELPQTTHTQVGMMQCYSTTPLEPEGSDNNCTLEVLTDSAQQLINVSESVGVDTVGSASLCESNQFTTELGLNKDQQQQQKSQWQKSQTHYMYNKLQCQRRKLMLVESKRYQKWRGKVKSMYVSKPTYVRWLCRRVATVV
ncbi:MAG: hypothetical protein GY820_10870 [Gammaproteobacteria bacterium]|nr:hypothetical protein [Gammaproteobacteria bacterium]